MLVVDASLVVEWCIAPGAKKLGQLVADQLCAPPLMWSEAHSALHERVWRRELNASEADQARSRLTHVDVKAKTHPRLTKEAWRIADDLGWAKTYDAEYVALASLLGCRLVTVDGRLRRGADRLRFVVGPTEL
ncbi:MAG TPA: type II toxin-antitoxin system VapC family toxin [Solirubrobacteraceae bacterium]|nr:type II toxin-antitoxin system VapC family toxin [Solirubrobacteraceae bacterium]